MINDNVMGHLVVNNFHFNICCSVVCRSLKPLFSYKIYGKTSLIQKLSSLIRITKIYFEKDRKLIAKIIFNESYSFDIIIKG